MYAQITMKHDWDTKISTKTYLDVIEAVHVMNKQRVKWFPVYRTCTRHFFNMSTYSCERNELIYDNKFTNTIDLKIGFANCDFKLIFRVF